MQGLRQVLGWDVHGHDPSLHDLHPSSGNLDHAYVWRVIDDAQISCDYFLNRSLRVYH